MSNSLPQASLTADKGKVGRLNIEFVKNHMRSLQTHYAEEGLHWLDEVRQVSKERKTLKELGLAMEDLAMEPQQPARS